MRAVPDHPAEPRRAARGHAQLGGGGAPCAGGGRAGGGADGVAGGGGVGASGMPQHHGDGADHLLLLHRRLAVPQGLSLGLRLGKEML